MRQIEGLPEGRISGSSLPQGAKMKQKYGPGKAPAEKVLKDIRRQTRRQYSAEEKIPLGQKTETAQRRQFSNFFGSGRVLHNKLAVDA
jgi:hypothetical protein